jgi:hypothetical protein
MDKIEIFSTLVDGPKGVANHTETINKKLADLWNSRNIDPIMTWLQTPCSPSSMYILTTIVRYKAEP